MPPTKNPDRQARVLLFSMLREEIGRSELIVDVETPISVRELLGRLSTSYPPIRKAGGSIRVAVNLEYVRGDHAVKAGDEVALITPVSGG